MRFLEYSISLKKANEMNIYLYIIGHHFVYLYWRYMYIITVSESLFFSPSTSLSFSYFRYFNEIYQTVLVGIRKCWRIIMRIPWSCTHLTSLYLSSYLKDHAVPRFSNTHPYNPYTCLNRIIPNNSKYFAVQFPPIRIYILPRSITHKQCNYHSLGTFFKPGKYKHQINRSMQYL